MIATQHIEVLGLLEVVADEVDCLDNFLLSVVNVPDDLDLAHLELEFQVLNVAVDQVLGYFNFFLLGIALPIIE